MTTQSLTTKILDAIPAGNYAFCGLLKLLDVVETTKVPTAAVECRRAPRLLVNPTFVEEHAETKEKLLMLVLHELNHILLGHTTLFPHVTEADNIVFDAVINAMLCRMYPDREHTSFFTDFYSTQPFPECLLRPPEGWPRHPRRPLGLAELPKGISERAWRVMRDLYSQEGATYEAVKDLLKCLKGTKKVILIGSHGEGFSPISNWEAVNSEVFEAIRRIVEDWDMPPDPLRGRSWNNVASDFVLKARRKAAQRTSLVKLIQSVGRKAPHARTLERGTTQTETLSAVLTPDRRHAVQRLCGFESLLYRDMTSIKRRSDVSKKVHLYIDVSGSMDGYIESIYGAAELCREMLEPKVHLFSTEVYDISLGQLHAGVCKSTYGTDIGCVAEHIREHHVKNAVLVTDGFVGAPAGIDAEVLKAVKLGIAYTELSSKTDLSPYADYSMDIT